MAKQIPLGKLGIFFATVSDEDYDRITQHKWSFLKIGHLRYAARRVGPKGSQKAIYMHREILDAPEGMEVDHRDGDGLMNTRENLRLVTHAENSRNRRIDSRNKSGVTGVSWYPQKNRWQALIRVGGKRVCLGRFKTFEEAVAARKAAEAQHYGEFARAA